LKCQVYDSQAKIVFGWSLYWLLAVSHTVSSLLLLSLLHQLQLLSLAHSLKFTDNLYKPGLYFTYPLVSGTAMTHCINTGSSKENITSNSLSVTAKLAPTPKKAMWLTANDVEMIRVLTEQQAAGNQSDNGWKSLVWTLVTKALQGSEVQSGGAAKTSASCFSH
jgi:hypothetical protein